MFRVGFIDWFMQNGYKVDVMSYDSSSFFLERGFLKCVVSLTNPPFTIREFAYCLHCQQLRSIPWFYKHKRLIGFEPSTDDHRVFRLKYNMFVQDIFTEVDYLNDLGKLFPGDPETILRLPGLDTFFQLPDFTRDIEQAHLFEAGPSDQNTNEQVFPDEDMVDDEFILQSERIAHCVSDCVEEICFDAKTFDPKRFASLVETFLTTK